MRPAPPGGRQVAAAMVTSPELHAPTTTVGELRAFFHDDHVRMALVVDAGELLAAVEPADLPPEEADGALARSLAGLAGRTVGPDTPLSDAIETMRRTGRRRLAVTGEDGVLLGLLCLKRSGLGFCSDADVRRRKQAAADGAVGREAAGRAHAR